MVPALFVFGLLLIPIGLWLERRRGTRPGTGSLMLDFGDPNVRRARRSCSWRHSSTSSSCQSRVLAPSSTASRRRSAGRPVTASCRRSSSRISRVRTHGFTASRAMSDPGAGAFLSAKLNGSRQLGLVMSGDLPSPDPDAHRQPAAPSRRPVSSVTGPIATSAMSPRSFTSMLTTKRTPRLGRSCGSRSAAIHSRHAARKRHSLAHESRERRRVSSPATKREQIPYVRTSTPDGQVREYFAKA